ncbi:polysaccharide pyruvyl transferase family protein [Halorientalis pallida]|uniref:Polysaccharide pyruvyl transferase family protein n=1 Tax=Halorientalis pallida TaxID=2479928 RepID=A0A498KRS6_9EURY|nr:polysaccharide pyruvyl transferase family protein [Halorientalis pallida]RXK46931.1 polysaccharide pyruvyl transferase family protein [Halorientalis pallida]
MLVGLSPCPRHASGNVGDQLLVEVTIELIEDIHGLREFEVYFKREDFTSRLDDINEADAILLFGFEIEQRQIRPSQYRIAEDLTTVEPPIIPIASCYSFFPGDRVELRRQVFGSETRSFIDRVVPACPDETIPVRDAWVGEVLEQNGYDTVLTGDPAWYALERLGDEFHRPQSVEQVVFTTPHSWQYVEQAKSLLRELTNEFPDARRIVSLHAAPLERDREICAAAKKAGWEIHYASHETDNLSLYKRTDLHVGYRYHGHLAHLRYRRPSILLEEDSRGRGLTETFGGGGIRAFESEYSTAYRGLPRRFADSTPIHMAHALANKVGLTNVLAEYSSLKGNARPEAVEETISMIQNQRSNGWPMLTAIRKTIDETYETGMQPFLQSALD